jgi:tetratricopeptide (TPR) repeat protein
MYIRKAYSYLSTYSHINWNSVCISNDNSIFTIEKMFDNYIMITRSIICTLFATLLLVKGNAQATFVYTDAEKKFKEAKQLFIQQQYGLAYPLFEQLQSTITESNKSTNNYLYDDVRYYYIVSRLKLQIPIAENEATQYIDWVNNTPRTALMSYHLAKYYFLQDDFSNAIKYYEQAGLDNLSNEEVADAKFEKAYAYFNLKRFEAAKPLFNEIHQLPDNKYYYAANYYYGFILFFEKKYTEALTCFRLVESKDEYKGVVPYYIAEIYYFQNKKEDALKYGESVLNRGGLYYEKEMKQLLGQIYFEKKEFAKALPLIEFYVNNSQKVSKEDVYELSYCYFETGKIDKAIEGLKQLSNEKDSLGQNSMYLLGNCYLKTNQKANARNAFQFCAINSSNKVQQEVAIFNYAKLSYELGYQDIALAELQKFINQYPNSTYNKEAKEIMVSLLANTNNFTDALALYQSFEKPTATMQKVYPRILYGRAVELLNDQQTNKAEELFTSIIQLPPSAVLPYAQFWKGEIAYRTSKYDEAIRYLTLFQQSGVAAQGEANYTTTRYSIGYSWLKKENYKQALLQFELIAKSSIAASVLEQDAFVRTADCYFMQKDFAKANGMYDIVFNNALSQSDYALFQKAMIAGIKSPAAKITLLNNLGKQYPNSTLVADANMEIADSYMSDEKFTEAIPYLNKITTIQNAAGILPKTYLKLGLSYYNLDKNAEALKNYTFLIQQYPQSAEADEAVDNIKSIYLEEGKPNEYVELMRKNGKNISNNEADSITYTAAELKYNNNDCAAAILAFNNYLNQFPQGEFAVPANFFKSECYNKLKDYTNALLGYDYVYSKGLNKYFERATLYAARIAYFEQKDFVAAKKYFTALKSGSANQDNQLEALRGLVRCYYQIKDYTQANETAKELLAKKGISTDDKSVAFLVLAKSQQTENDCQNALASFKSCAAINKSAWGAEARFEIANCQFGLSNFSAAEKAAQATIRETSSYDFWVTKSYILLGDIFLMKKDYFNAKATYQSVADNAVIVELKDMAKQKLATAIQEEKLVTKINE